jgi:hypothetical protein
VSGDKSKLLTQNVLLLLLQRDMEKNIKTLKENMRHNLQKEREKHRIEQQNMKVSFPMHIQMRTTLLSFIPVLFSCPQTLHKIYFLYFRNNNFIILHLNYQKLY